MRPNPDVVALLERELMDAKAGITQAVYVLSMDAGGEYESAFEADDLGDMLYELGSEIIRLRSSCPLRPVN